jgi:two-component system cell cycle response regulator CtrA
MRVLFIEDDLYFAGEVSRWLKSAGSVVDHVEAGEDGLDLVRHYDCDIVILDLMLRDIEG